MPWNRVTLLEELRKACTRGWSQEIRELERLARDYGAADEEIAKAKAAGKARRGGDR